MATTHLSEENLSRLLCEEECGSIPDPELYCHFSVVTASSQEQLIRAPRCSAVRLAVAQWQCASEISALSLCLPLQNLASQGAGMCIVSHTCWTNACSLSVAIHIKMPRKRCFLQCHSFFELLTVLSFVMLCLQSSRSSFSPPFLPYCHRDDLSC